MRNENAYELMAALCKIIKDNDGSIPQHERPRAMEIVNRLTEDFSEVERLKEAREFMRNYSYPALRGHNG